MHGLGPYIVANFVAHSHTPHDRCVRFVVAVADDHATLATRRPASTLPGPDFHRLDRTSLAWRTHIFAQYLLRNHPQGKIGILYQNDDYGKDYVKGLKDGLNGKMQITAELPYETTDPTIDSQIVSIKASGADIFYDVTTPKFSAQAIKKAAEIEWKPIHLLNGIASSVGSTLRPAGLEISKGIVSTTFGKDPTDPQWKEDPAYKEWVVFMDRYYPNGDKTTNFTVYGYSVAQTLVEVLKQCGDDLTQNVMKQAANLHDLRIGMLLPGIAINTSQSDYAPIKQMQMQRFNGQTWELFGPLLNGALTGG